MVVYVISHVSQIFDKHKKLIRTNLDIGPVFTEKEKADAFIDELKDCNRIDATDNGIDIIEEEYKQGSYYKITRRNSGYEYSEYVTDSYVIKKRTTR